MTSQARGISNCSAGRLLGVLGAFLLFLTGEASADSSEVTLSLTSVKCEYVLREPVKFTVTFKNVSSSAVAMVNLELLGSNMDFMELEITRPDGVTEIRSTKHDYVTGPLVPAWRGEPFMPDDEIKVDLTPNASIFVGGGIRDWSQTFSAPGQYVVKVYYVVPLDYKNLWKGPQGRLMSNTVTVTFREPTTEESAILDAYWTKGGYWISLGEHGIDCRFDRLRVPSRFLLKMI